MIRKAVSSVMQDVKQSTSSITRQTPPTRTVSTIHENDPTFGIWQPNQTTRIFQRMEKTCPDALKAYAQCVIEKQNNGVLVKGACDESFGKVMDCFRTVRR